MKFWRIVQAFSVAAQMALLYPPVMEELVRMELEERGRGKRA
jgi:hypothetical protein